MKQQIIGEIRRQGLVAILRGVPKADIADVGRALLDGGITLMEVALSEPEALGALTRLREAMPPCAWVGAGTVTSELIASSALAAGAQFFVTPHVVADVGEFAKRHDLAVIMGAMTPTEVTAARALGADIVKLFPAATLGPGYVKALLGPYPDLELLVVGGIGPENLSEFLRAGALGAGIGSVLTRQWSQQPADQGATQSIARTLTETVASFRSLSKPPKST